MATEITGRNFEVTPDIRKLLETKIAKVQDRLFDDASVIEGYRRVARPAPHDEGRVARRRPPDGRAGAWWRVAVITVTGPAAVAQTFQVLRTRTQHAHPTARSSDTVRCAGASAKFEFLRAWFRKSGRNLLPKGKRLLPFNRHD